MKWSKYQKALFDDVANGKRHTIVEAVAGSGKTTSLLESLNFIPDQKTWLLVAFNKRIASELKNRAPDSYFGDIRTLHSLGLKTIYSRFPHIRVDNNKMRRILDKIVGKNKKLWDLKSQINKTITLCKGYLVDGDEFIDHIMDNHDIDIGEIDRDQFIHYVQKSMEASRKETKSVDFNDMIWFPYVYNLTVQKYDRVFVDECQDLNNGQIALALKACKKNGRIMAFGDRSQAIYGFAGASLYSMDNIKTKLKAKELPLSITYRCPQAVVHEAQRFASQIEAAPKALKGIVQTISHTQMIKQAKSGCFILSRTNAPLIGLALGFIRNSIPAIIQGRDIGQNLLALIKKSRRKTISSFLNWLDSWEKKEVTRLLKKNANPLSIQDKAACLRALTDACNNITEMKNKITILFEDTDDNEKIVLSTVHKAKGLERNIVYMLATTFRFSTQEERNINYVAITRSASELYYVK